MRRFDVANVVPAVSFLLLTSLAVPAPARAFDLEDAAVAAGTSAPPLAARVPAPGSSPAVRAFATLPRHALVHVFLPTSPPGLDEVPGAGAMFCDLVFATDFAGLDAAEAGSMRDVMNAVVAHAAGGGTTPPVGDFRNLNEVAVWELKHRQLAAAPEASPTARRSARSAGLPALADAAQGPSSFAGRTMRERALGALPSGPLPPFASERSGSPTA